MANSRGAISELVRRALYVLSRGHCYAPECIEPVILIDGGEPVFIGEVAHIVGAVESGPRGDVEVEDRDAFANLLVLCHRHHTIIHNPRTRDRYPVAVLREWKTTREADFDTRALTELRRLPDLASQLPDLMVEAFHSATADLEATVDKLEALGQLTHETAQLLHAALASTSAGGPAVGDGVPGIKEAFEEAYDAAGGASFLGLPSADAFELGPGFVQHLRGARCGHPAVICAIRHKPAVVVPADLWNAITYVGESATGGGVHGVGFPTSAAGGDHRYVAPDARHVRTTAGSWGTGAMVRGTDGRWRWVPDVTFDINTGGDVDTAIDSQQRLDLRLRLVATMPVAQPDVRTTAAGRRRLAAAIAKPDMAAILASLAAERTAVPSDLTWRQRDDPYAHNDTFGVSYEATIKAADGRSAMYGSVQFLMPSIQRSMYPTSFIDVRIDFDGCQAEACKPNTPVDKRISLAEIVEFFTRAWSIAFDVLPLALDDPSDGDDPGGKPRVSLYIINERPRNSGGERAFDLYDLVDLSQFGATHKQQAYRLDLAVLGRGSLPEHEARELVREALARVADNAGFDSADLVSW